ncbi:MAG: glycosyltransferase family 39 protein [Patescibacteria group bacterium]
MFNILKRNIIKNREAKYLFFIIFIFLVSIFIVNPIGEYALNDDWVYYDAVRQMLNNNLNFDSYVGPALIGQLIYSIILSMIFGFSFSLLRLSTLFLSLLGIIFLYKLLVNLSISPKKSFLISLLFLFNPIYYNLSFTFMTDIHALSFVVIALFFYQKGFKFRKDKDFLIASLLIVFASLIRQNYILFLLIFDILFFIWHYQDLKLRKFLVIYTLPVCCYVFFVGLLSSSGWWPQSTYNLHSFEKLEHVFLNIWRELYSSWHYISLFILPILISWLWHNNRREKILNIIIAIIVSGFSGFLYFFKAIKFPYSGNIISQYGLGPRDPDGVLSGTPEIVITNYLCILLTAIGGFAAGILLIMFYRFFRKLFKKRRSTSSNVLFYFFILLNLIAQWIVIMSIISFDRYYLVLVLLFLILLTWLIKKIKINKISMVIICILASVSIVGTFNYLRENELKWSIANVLVKKGININSIDGGYEWLGWNWFHRKDSKILSYYDPIKPWYITRLFPDNTREYIISYNSEKNNYTLIL